ncbi:LOW QUALITY PROTEIN: group 3 secretory phospholipase A2 [Ara ararauna]
MGVARAAGCGCARRCPARARAVPCARSVASLWRGGPGAAALVQSAWGGRSRLRARGVRRDPRLARALRAACTAPGSPDAPGAALRRVLAALWRLRASCTDPASPAEPPRRRRRGCTFPGTLRCGAGDSEGNARWLRTEWGGRGGSSGRAHPILPAGLCSPTLPVGLFRGLDRCCREHDQCSAQITALQFNYGIRNYRLHTISHCQDARFRQCLRLNDTISNIIGVTFFNLVEAPCFVLEKSEECVRWHWWGGCERYGVVPLARMVQQCQNDYSLPTEGTGSPAVQTPGKGGEFSRVGHKRLQGLSQNSQLYQAQRPATAQQPQGPGTLSPASTRDKAEPRSRHAAAQRGLEPMPTAMIMLEDLAGGRLVPGGALQGSGCSAHPACPQDGSIQSSPAVEWCRAPHMTVVAGHRQQQGEWVLGVEYESQLGCPKVSAHGGRVLGVPLTALLSSGLGRVCKSYKHLDKCEHQFVPSEVKYQLHNMETLLFHCNCTRRCGSRRKRHSSSHHHRALCADTSGSGKVGYPTWPAAAGCCPAVPTGWHGSCTG